VEGSYNSIEQADSFVFVISPDSVRSQVCRNEIDHAIANNKRFIPLLRREITDAADQAACIRYQLPQLDLLP